MSGAVLRLSRFHRLGAAVHGVALSGDGEHLLAGTEQGLHLVDRHGSVIHRLDIKGRAFSAVALSPRLDAGLAMARAGLLYRLDFRRIQDEERSNRLQVAAVGIWEQQDDLYSLDFAPGNEGNGLIALGHHALGLTALDGRGRLLWRLGPREGVATKRRTWHATIGPDCRTIYAAPLNGAPGTDRGEVFAVDVGLGKPVRSAVLPGRVALLASLPAPLGVAAVTHARNAFGFSCHMLAFDPGLQSRVWTLSCPPAVAITAVASAPGRAVLTVGTNTGELWQVGAFTGRILARYDLLFSSTVLSVAVAGTGEIAAGLANGQVAFLERANNEREGAA